jgi:hypothetical integral membrane protein (TIGR02206 family)
MATGVLAFLNLSAYPLGQAAWMASGIEVSLDNVVPLHLCDLAAMVAGFALLTRNRVLCGLTYFWGLGATFQALLTPAIQVGFPQLPFLMFFVHHFAVVGAALYLPLAAGWRPPQPWWRGPIQAYGWTLGYLVVAMAANRWLGTNFGFASRPPDNPSLIDHLGAWPWYLWWMGMLALLVFCLLALPFRRLNGAVK